MFSINHLYPILLIASIFLTTCAFGPEPTPVLVYLPTATATPVPTATATPKPSPTTTGTPTLTPEPWLEINLKLYDAETGEAVVGDVYMVLFVDDKTITNLIEEDVSQTTFNIPRAVTRADGIVIQILAEGYLTRGARLSSNEVKSLSSLSVQIPLERSRR
jgi:hypothetical protein